MAVFFLYSNSIIFWIESIVSTCILVTVDLLIFKAGKNQPEGVKHSNLLIKIGIINMVVVILMNFIPQMYLTEFNQKDFQFYKIYNLIIRLIIPISSLVTFGIFLTIFGKSNREIYENIPMTAGISFSISYIIQIITAILYMTLLIDYFIYYPGFSIEGNLMWFIYLVLINFWITAFLFGLILMLAHGKINKDKFIHKAVLLLLVHFLTMSNLYWILRTIF